MLTKCTPGVRVERGGTLLHKTVGRLLVHTIDTTYACHFFDASTAGTVRVQLATAAGPFVYKVEYRFRPRSGRCSTRWQGGPALGFNAYRHCALATAGDVMLRLEFARVSELWQYEPTFQWMTETEQLECLLDCKNMQAAWLAV